MVVLGKPRELGPTVIVAEGAVAVAVKATEELPVLFSVIVEFFVPAEVGWKETSIVQVAPIATKPLIGQEPLVRMLNSGSVEVATGARKAICAVPVDWIVKVLIAETAPTTVEPGNVKGDGVIVEAATVCAVPDPVRTSKALIEPAKTLR